MDAGSVRRALYVLFARLFARAPNEALYARLRGGGLEHLAAAQRVDLTSDLLDAGDAAASAAELEAEYARICARVSLRASDYSGVGSEDPVAAVSAFLSEHRLALDERAGLACDHLAVILGVMGELAGQSETALDRKEAHIRAGSFFLRHLDPWARRALSEVSAHADRAFYRGLAAMLDAFLESERRLYRGEA